MKKIILTMLLGLGFMLGATAQDRTITGKVVDEKGNALEGITVSTSDAKSIKTSDKLGNYRISVPSTSKVLIFSGVNYDTYTLKLSKSDNEDVKMNTKSNTLDELVVVGYEVKKRRDIIAPSSRVSGSTIADKPSVNLANGLQGETPGAQINAFNGVPGGAVNVKIRGALSIAAGAGGTVSPLYIIDGVQVLSSNPLALSYGNGFETTASTSLLNSINPDDIESIEILKDPATASIYGAQAANGVVRITTKKGKNGKTKLSFSTNVGMSRVIKKLDILNATDFAQLGYEANANRYGATAANTTNFLTAVGATVTNGKVNQMASTNWQDLAFRQGLSQEYNLSMSGGNEKTNFLISGGYSKIEGHVVASDYQRGNINVNIENKATSKLTIGANLKLSSSTQNGVSNGGTFGNPVRNGFLSSPTNTPYLSDGVTYRSTANGTWFGGIDNFLTYTNFDLNFANIKNLIGSVNMIYKISKNFTYNNSFSTNYSYSEEKQFGDPRYSSISVNGSVAKFSRQITDFQNNHVINYSQRFARKHEINALLGVEYRSNLNTSFSASGYGVALPQFTTLSATALPQAPTEGYSSFKLQSFFGKVGYVYSNKYTVNATLRRDGSSRFGKGNRFGYFPSVAVAWNAANENFFSDKFRSKNDIKFRLSYGITGVQDVLGSFGNRGLFGLSGEYVNLGGATPTQLENRDLSWEENETYNAGIDLSILNKRVSIEFDVYKSNRSKLLLAVPIPSTNGFTSINKNLGAAQIKGFDAALTTKNLVGKNLTWTTSFNIGYNKNKITDLGAGVTQIGTLYKVGEQLNSIFTYKYAGVNPADGRPMYYDTLGNITYVPALRDRYYLKGSYDPTFSGGLTNTIGFKNFGLRVQCIYQGGNYINNSDAAFLQRAGSTFDRNQIGFQMERWQKPGDVTRVPRPYAGGTQPNASSNSFTSDRFFERGDFARIKEVTLSYSLTKEVLEKLKVSSATIRVSAFNVYTWSNYTGYDPELQVQDFGTYPQARQTQIGLNVTF